MATAESVKAKLTSLIAQANTVTGGDAATLTEAVAALVAGFGAGGGTLGIKSGTITIASNYAEPRIQHGCGKLPLVSVFYMIDPPLLTATPSVNRLTGGFWHRDSFAMTITSNSTIIVGGMQRPYVVGGEIPDNTITVDAELLVIRPAVQWYFGTYAWLTIYEV